MASLPLPFLRKQRLAQAILAALALANASGWAASDGRCAPGKAACLRLPGEMLAANDLKDLVPTDDAAAPPSRSDGLPSLVPSDDDAPPAREDGDGLLSLSRKEPEGPKLRGFLQQETAYTYAAPAHFSTAVVRAHVGSSGQWSANLKWKASVIGEVDPVYAWLDYYPDPVRNDQRFYGIIGETYIDTSLKGWDLRLGRQNVVWGEMVGLFFADVVTAKDLRHFILPSFDVIRIPQWAARGEYFLGDSHIELLWIPYTTFDRIGKAGSEFYPFQVPPPAGFSHVFRDDMLPARSISNSNYGARVSTLAKGWDLSAFFYSSMDSAATFYRDIVPSSPTTGTIVYTPRHDRISQTGGTFSKDLGEAGILKGELVFTSGRSFNVSRITQANGVVQKDTIDYAVGLDYTLPEDARLNVQAFQRIYFGHDQDMLQDRYETGATFLYNRKLRQKVEGEILWIQSLNRWENLIRPRIIWRAEQNLRVAVGVDVFNGPVTGVLGRYANRDRIYVETRYDF